MADALLRIENLSVDIDTSRGLIHPVRNVSLHIEPGEMLGLVGESGSGKSVTAMTVPRLMPRETVHIAGGAILFDGVPLHTKTERQMRAIRGNDIAVIFQEPMTALNPVFTVEQQMVEPLQLHLKMRRSQARARSLELLDMVGIRDPGRVLNSYPHELSGGMQQRVMIAMAMSCNPKLLIADEPTTALDVTTQLQILDLMVDLQQEHGTSVLLITHDLGVVAQTCARASVMSNGEIVEAGVVEDLFSKPQHEYTKRLLSFIPSGRGHIAGLISERPSDPARAERNPRAEGETPVVSVRGLRKVFTPRGHKPGTEADVIAVDDVSFDVYRGQTVAVVGESGSGKSTAGRSILRLHEPTAGEVEFNGTDVLALGPDAMRRIRKDMQIIFQDTYSTLDPRWSIGRSLGEALRLHTDRSRDEINDRIAQTLTTVGLPVDSMYRFAHEFSGGQRQRLGIARALLLDPTFVVCDEPVSALDVSVQAQILELMQELQESLDLSYLFITHDLSVVEMIADYVLVMNRGKVVEQGPVDAIYSNPQHAYTRALLAAVPVADPSQRVDRSKRRELVDAGLAAASEM